MTRGLPFTQDIDTGAEAAGSVVYFVEIGRNIKIGVTRNLGSRLKAFETSADAVRLLLAIPGDRTLEKRIHGLFSEERIARELFRRDYRLFSFIDNVEYGGLARGLEFLEATTPEARSRKKMDDRQKKAAEARRSKSEKDAYFAGLVADRKQRLGW